MLLYSWTGLIEADLWGIALNQLYFGLFCKESFSLPLDISFRFPLSCHRSQVESLTMHEIRSIGEFPDVCISESHTQNRLLSYLLNQAGRFKYIGSMIMCLTLKLLGSQSQCTGFATLNRLRAFLFWHKVATLLRNQLWTAEHKLFSQKSVFFVFSQIPIYLYALM